MPPQDDDETIKLRRDGLDAAKPRLTSRRLFIGCAICAGVAAGGLGWRYARSPNTVAPPPPPPRPAPAPAAPPLPPLPAATIPKTPITTAGEAAIIANHPTNLDVFRFDRNPRILVLDFASLARQGAMLNRLAAMIEKNGQPHDRALDDTSLDAAIRATGDTPETFYYGHDYGMMALNRFFATVDRQQIKLTSDELWLRALLEQEAASIPDGPLGLISIPAIGGGGVSTDMRATILHHELSHGEFFTNAAYADWTRAFWTRVLDDKLRDAFRTFLTSQDYDSGIEELAANETQAYLMFTPNPAFFRADQVGLTPTGLAEWRHRFRDGMPQGWLREQAFAEAAR